jgi:hypothetical protein
VRVHLANCCVANSSSSAFAFFRSRGRILSEPAVRWSEQVASFLRFALVAPEPCKAHFGVLRPSPSHYKVTIPIVPPPPRASRCIGADAGLQQKTLFALSYSVLDAARHPSQGGCCAPSDTQENAKKGSVVAQSQVFNPAWVLWNMIMARNGLTPPTPPTTPSPPSDRTCQTLR